MLEKSDLKGTPPGTVLHYVCNRCKGSHYFYGSAKPDNLHYCRLCLQAGERNWINRIQGSKCHVLSQGDTNKRNKRLTVIRNNPGPYKRKRT